MKIKHFICATSLLTMAATSTLGQDTWSFEDLIRVGDNNGKFGYIDMTGKVVVPCTLDDAGDFSEGLAYVGHILSQIMAIAKIRTIIRINAVKT